jgi:hypothetical protein
LDILKIDLNGHINYMNDKIYDLRLVEKASYVADYSGFSTVITFDQYNSSMQGALYSIYTTSFIIVLLIVSFSLFFFISIINALILKGGTYFFSSDVNKLVIGPIERLVELVRKISANPLGVEYKMLGEKEGFIDGMETTMLLTTITKIGIIILFVLLLN